MKKFYWIMYSVWMLAIAGFGYSAYQERHAAHEFEAALARLRANAASAPEDDFSGKACHDDLDEVMIDCIAGTKQDCPGHVTHAYRCIDGRWKLMATTPSSPSVNLVVPLPRPREPEPVPTDNNHRT